MKIEHGKLIDLLASKVDVWITKLATTLEEIRTAPTIEDLDERAEALCTQIAQLESFARALDAATQEKLDVHNKAKMQ